MKASDLEEIRRYLSNVSVQISAKRLSEASGFKQRLKNIKEVAVSNTDQDTAKLVWCYEQILNIQRNYLQAFGNLKSGKYLKRGVCSRE